MIISRILAAWKSLNSPKGPGVRNTMAMKVQHEEGRMVFDLVIRGGQSSLRGKPHEPISALSRGASRRSVAKCQRSQNLKPRENSSCRVASMPVSPDSAARSS